MAPRSKTVFQGIKDYPKERLKNPELGGPSLKLPKISIQDYAAGSPLRLNGSEGPFILTQPRPKKQKLPGP